jgi:hypothetical protein
MALFMDIHRNVEGVTHDGLKEAHQKDLEIQAKHGVSFQKYWYNEEEKAIFCLAEAPNKEAAQAVHLYRAEL